MVDTHSFRQGVFGNMFCERHMFSATKPGTEWTLHRSNMTSYQCWSHLKFIVLRKFLTFLLWLRIKLKAMKRPRKLFSFLWNLRPDIHKRSVPLSKWELTKAKWEAIIISSIVELASSLMKTTAANWMLWNLLLVGMWDITAFGLDVPFTS